MIAGDGKKGVAKAQESSTRLPTIDLEAAIKAVVAIHDKAVETASMPEVATALGYGGPTSSPFYRRISAARLFGLLGQKSSLTQAAKDYMFPHDERTKELVLERAILGISYYRDLIRRYSTKKLNVDLVKNSITKDCGLDGDSAMTCAKAFENSLKFAGMLSGDGVVRPMQSTEERVVKGDAPEEQNQKANKVSPAPSTTKPDDGADAETQEHTLFLDNKKERKFTVTAPLEINRAEYERICKWLEFALLINDEKKEPPK